MPDASPEDILNAIKKLTPEQRHWLRETLAAGTREAGEAKSESGGEPHIERT